MLLAVSAPTLEYANVGLAAAGVVLWVVVLTRWVRRGCRNPLADAPRRSNDLHPVAVPIAMLAYLGGLAAAHFVWLRAQPEDMPIEVIDHVDIVLRSMTAGVVGAIVCIWLGGAGFHDGIRGFGLRVDHWRHDVATGVAALLMGFPVCWALLIASEAVHHWFRPGATPPTHPVLEALADPGFPTWAAVIGVAGPIITAPVAEELFFRGIVQSTLREILPKRWHALVVTAVVFGGAHYAQPQVVVPLTVLGFILGWVYEWRGSLLAPIVLHVLFNSRTMLWQALLHAGPAG
jgi:membrane protease YdiL (CAAX protease family)